MKFNILTVFLLFINAVLFNSLATVGADKISTEQEEHIYENDNVREDKNIAGEEAKDKQVLYLKSHYNYVRKECK